MFFNHSVVSLRRALIALALSACAGLASAAQTFHIELDTTSFGSSAGWIDLQFNPAQVGAPFAFAGVSNFTGFGDSAGALIDGNVTGSLATGYTLFSDGTVDLNALLHAANFGGTIGFDVTIDGTVTPSTNTLESVFSVALYNQALDTVLGTNDPNASLVLLNWSPLGTVTSTPLTNTIGTSVTNISAVPEPQTWLLLGAGLALVGGLARRRRALAA